MKTCRNGHTYSKLKMRCPECDRARTKRWRDNVEGGFAAFRKNKRMLHVEQYLLENCRSRSKRKGREREFNLTLEDIIIPEKCPVLGIPLHYDGNYNNDSCPSIDRIDSSKGYIKGNVVIVSWRANRLKNNGTPNEHRMLYEFYSTLK
jgi:hypothetical protein